VHGKFTGLIIYQYISWRKVFLIWWKLGKLIHAAPAKAFELIRLVLTFLKMKTLLPVDRPLFSHLPNFTLQT
jgi:hypothetical protein